MAAASINFLIVHGAMGYPGENWFPWLKQKLEQGGNRVEVPQFPTPDGQFCGAWLAIAERTLQNFDPASTILIGHSTGAVFVLRLAEIASQPYKAVFSVCPFMHNLNLEPYDKLNATFIHHRFDWGRVKNNGGKIFCFAGDDDPYVPLAYSREVADHSGASLTVIEKGGHLNAESGYVEFPLLLGQIRSFLPSTHAFSQ